MSTWIINWTRSCSDVVAFACVILALRLGFLQTYELTNIFVDLFEYHFQVLRMISEVMLQVLADHKSILYGLRSERFGVKFCVELKCLRIVVLRLIMPSRMTKRSVGHATVAPRGGRTDRWTGRGGGRTRGRSDDQSNGGIEG
ncbi:hypothetical protein Tco_0817782 [Tanacetum coccineum]